MTPRRAQAKNLKRKTASRPERKTVVIFCEGKASEPDYINGLKQLPNVHRKISLNIEIDPRQGVPQTLVKLAISRAVDNEVDECWCVFDVEWPTCHPNLKQACQLARDHNIRLAISNPCFELWLILHFEYQTAFLDTDEAKSKSRRLDGHSGNRINAEQYMSLRHKAAQRASSLSCRHEQDQTPFPHDNPSSTMRSAHGDFGDGALSKHEPASRRELERGAAQPAADRGLDIARAEDHHVAAPGLEHNAGMVPSGSSSARCGPVGRRPGPLHVATGSGMMAE